MTANGTLSCGYHGWEFNATGSCVRVPQLKPGAVIPGSCRLKTLLETHTINNVVYVRGEGASQTPTPTEGMHWNGFVEESEAFVTDYQLEANYDFWIQMENLMDPAHIHFVHDGFQGDRAKANYIRLVSFQEDAWRIQAEFTHDDPLIPDIRITFDAPGTIDVCILGAQRETVRRNIIYVTPIEPGKCRVLFRDVAYKKYLMPDGWDFPSRLLGIQSVNDVYQRINNVVVEQIMEQDIDILESQQKGMQSRGTLEDYLAAPVILLTESDRMILAYRQWCKKNAEWLKSNGYV
jgi:phenylpropionate dioxygenase-like ring-hydroxylating dioxygenase large terminal subunit